jgi:hypothetical protein
VCDVINEKLEERRKKRRRVRMTVYEGNNRNRQKTSKSQT